MQTLSPETTPVETIEASYLWDQITALWPDWARTPSIRGGVIMDECALVDAFGSIWGLDSTTPYLIPDAGQYNAAPTAYDRRMTRMLGEV